MDSPQPELSAIDAAQRIIKSISGNLTDKETAALQSWRDRSESNDRLYHELIDEKTQSAALERLQRFNAEAALERFHSRHEAKVIPLHKEVVRRRRWYIGAAASLLLLLSAGGYFYLHHNLLPSQPVIAQHDVLPGGNKAVLTLANGKQIILDSAAKGTVAQQNGVSISKTKNGQLVYQLAANAALSPVQYNTITTPAGGQYEVILPDQTKVWLNASSSLRYPTRFEGKNRTVELTGEGYFAVVHNPAQPFMVKTKGQVVTDIGTVFNINAYGDEPAVTTTLVSGAVNVSAANHTSRLNPGYQAINHSGQLQVTSADLDEATAWKDGQFIFHNTDLKSIMRQLQRWYNVQIDMSNLPDQHFNGAMGRDVKLSQVLHMLELTSNLKFNIEGRRIMLIR